jgi:UDP:flavonoid glycosyltransferase YjiC (YdhE family)
VPPLTCGVRPSDAGWSPLRVRAAWAGARLRLAIDARMAGAWKGTLHCPARMHRLRSVFLRIAARADYDCIAGRTYRQTDFGPRLALPEIALCPAAFQLPGAPDVGRWHLDDVVDHDRAEEPVPDGIDPAKPLVYCSLGSAAEIYPHAGRCFAAVVAMSVARPDWQVVLHVADWEGPLPALPVNLIVRRRVPQLALLRRAAAMVTHGGTNSIIECVAYGVPMVVVSSGLRDHPGNAVRAAHHRLAVTTRMGGITGAELVALVERARASSEIRDGLARMRRAIATEHGVSEAVEYLEGIVRARDRALRSRP